jgi:hypothetical protein
MAGEGNSALFRKGALGNINGSSTEGRFLRDAEAQLSAHLGGTEALTLPQKLLVARLARVMLRQELLDRKYAAGQCSEFDLKVIGALGNQFRLLVRELGMKPAPAAPLSVKEALRAGSDAA